MNEPTTEIAKAVQETAKTTDTAIKATERLGSYLAKVFGEPVDSVVGILSDRLRFIRWERQCRLLERMREIVEQKGITLSPGILMPKLALPIIECASLEENNDLQDLWVRLLVNAMNPDHEHLVRSAFIQILRELEPLDAYTLNTIFIIHNNISGGRAIGLSHNKIGIKRADILREQAESANMYEEIMDNLFRLRLCAPYIENTEMMIVANGEFAQKNSSNVREYEEVSLTAFGSSFIKACII